MPLFRCSGCGCVENTALSRWAVREIFEHAPAVCSACDPKIRQWHGEFEQRSAVGMVMGADGFLYTAAQFASGEVHHTKPLYVVTEVQPDGSFGGGKSVTIDQ